MSWLSSLLGTGSKKTTTTTALDPASQKYVDAMRAQGQGASGVALNGGPFFTGPQTMSVGDQAAAFMNPYMQNVVGATQGHYDQLRADALNQTKQQATLGGGFGGSRMAVLAGSRLGQLDQGQAQTISGLLAGGYQNALSQGTAYAEHQRQLQQQQMQEPIWRQQMAQGFMQGGMGPYGQTSTSTQPGGGLLGTIGGLGMTAMGMGWNPFGGGQQPTQFAQPQPWQAPSWNPQYRGPFG
jgi:hypothetical protein